MTEPLDLDALAVTTGNATRGPWVARQYGKAWHVEDENYESLAWFPADPDGDEALNAAFIAAARNALPALIERVRVAEARIDAVRALTFMSDDESEWQHAEHDEDEGEPECPACWAESIRVALDGDA